MSRSLANHIDFIRTIIDDLEARLVDDPNWHELRAFETETRQETLAAGQVFARQRLEQRLLANPHYRARQRLLEAAAILSQSRENAEMPSPVSSAAFAAHCILAGSAQSSRSDDNAAARSASSADAGALRPDGPPQDLTRIRGIDRGLAQKLSEIGVVRYDAIANWTRDDCDRVSRELGLGRSIHRQNWIEQAALLARQQATEPASVAKRAQGAAQEGVAANAGANAGRAQVSEVNLPPVLNAAAGRSNAETSKDQGKLTEMLAGAALRIVGDAKARLPSEVPSEMLEEVSLQTVQSVEDRLKRDAGANASRIVARADTLNGEIDGAAAAKPSAGTGFAAFTPQFRPEPHRLTYATRQRAIQLSNGAVALGVGTAGETPDEPAASDDRTTDAAPAPGCEVPHSKWPKTARGPRDVLTSRFARLRRLPAAAKETEHIAAGSQAAPPASKERVLQSAVSEQFAEVEIFASGCGQPAPEPALETETSGLPEANKTSLASPARKPSGNPFARREKPVTSRRLREAKDNSLFGDGRSWRPSGGESAFHGDDGWLPAADRLLSQHEEASVEIVRRPVPRPLDAAGSRRPSSEAEKDTSLTRKPGLSLPRRLFDVLKGQ